MERSWVKRLTSRALRWGYDAVATKAKRQPPTAILRDEDAELNITQRAKLLSASRDLHRNFVTAAWMIRRHLDYVTTFRFEARTGNRDLNRKLKGLMYEWGKAASFDITGRHPMRRFLRLLEARAVLDGDVFVHRLANGQVQAIEGDRVRSPLAGLPQGITAAQLTHGILTDDVGRVQKVCVCRRSKTTDFSPNGGSFTFERLLESGDVYQHGFFDRFDQVRGVSPLAPALNSLRDSYEGIDYALAKAKVAQLFALAIFRGDPEAIT